MDYHYYVADSQREVAYFVTLSEASIYAVLHNLSLFELGSNRRII